MRKLVVPVEQIRSDIYWLLGFLGVLLALFKGAVDNDNFAYWLVVAVGAGVTGLSFGAYGRGTEFADGEGQFHERVFLLLLMGVLTVLHAAFVVFVVEFVFSGVLSLVGWR